VRLRDRHAGVFAREFKLLEEMTSATVSRRVTSAALIGGFAVIALAISLVGLYGTLSMQVEQRRREIGIRMALGASRVSILRMILNQGARILAGGLVVGLAGSLAAGYLVRHMLYGVGPADLQSISWAVALLCAAGLCACLAPAIGAIRVDPARTLRAE